MGPHRHRTRELERLAIGFALVLAACWGMLRLINLVGDEAGAGPDDGLAVDLPEDARSIEDLAAGIESGAPAVDPNDLATLPDARIDAAVIDLIEWEIGDDWDREREILREMGPGYRPFYAMWLIESDVDSLGLLEAASWGETYLADAAEGYRLIGAVEHAALIEQVLALYRAAERALTACADDPAACAVEPDYLAFSQLETDWFASSEDAVALRAAYVRAHPEQFAGA